LTSVKNVENILFVELFVCNLCWFVSIELLYSFWYEYFK